MSFATQMLLVRDILISTVTEHQLHVLVSEKASWSLMCGDLHLPLSNLMETVNQILGKETSIEAYILKCLFFSHFFIASSNHGQCFKQLLGCLHFKDITFCLPGTEKEFQLCFQEVWIICVSEVQGDYGLKFSPMLVVGHRVGLHHFLCQSLQHPPLTLPLSQVFHLLVSYQAFPEVLRL